jgi:hypothetical protein
MKIPDSLPYHDCQTALSFGTRTIDVRGYQCRTRRPARRACPSSVLISNFEIRKLKRDKLCLKRLGKGNAGSPRG